ncbi:hypothetical protein [Microcoleus asticus]|uniref:Uncharacterized protein n=1 Tax=Microcoleus asticus IPMA8 TaxID=2563858 RepID=A0ABX2D9T7_9CYAN|nr:hypothetical protein [Microcoleus asticus]NQE38360.1 hypothetical protein [Microcoleus asticus IPMA8]
MATAAPQPKIGMILRELASRKIRSSSTGGNLIRTWSSSALTTSQGSGGFLETIINGALRFGNFLISGVVSLISFSFTKLWSWIVSATVIAQLGEKREP